MKLKNIEVGMKVKSSVDIYDFYRDYHDEDEYTVEKSIKVFAGKVGIVKKIDRSESRNTILVEWRVGAGQSASSSWVCHKWLSKGE